jgi:hypothetical protein
MMTESIQAQPLTASTQPGYAREQASTASNQPVVAASSRDRSGRLSLWQVNLLRVGYLFMGVGLAVVKWPLLFDHASWGLAEGTKECMLVALSVLALMGIRYPVRMLPILLFEVAWKLTWLGVVALPLWRSGTLEGAARDQTGWILWVVVIIAVIPWRYVAVQYVTAPAEPWRRPR